MKKYNKCKLLLIISNRKCLFPVVLFEHFINTIKFNVNYILKTNVRKAYYLIDFSRNFCYIIQNYFAFQTFYMGES